MSLRHPLSVALPLLAALALGACGSGSGSDGSGAAAQGDTPAQPPSTSGLPSALAANVRQADRIVGEGEGDFQKQLKRMRGYPVVVNQWASWCDPCRFEFPFFHSMTTKYRKQVGFIGLDMQDRRNDAEEFLRELPSGFPTIFDPDASVTASLGGGQASPTTFFLDREGKVVNVKIGAYATVELLKRDIRRHALKGS
jgi:cytochrome c biogenesis protein CcmG, thiol:disulfide interchange protein DsbE